MNILDFIIKFGTRGNSQVISATSQIQRQLDRTAESATSLSKSLGGGLKNAIMSLPGAQFFTNPIVALTSGLGVVSSLGMQSEKTAKSFDVLVGSSEQAGKMLSEINDYADNTLWSRMDASEAAQSLLAYSIPANKVVKDLKMLGDISMGDKNKLSTLAMVFGQVSSAGKLLTQDYKQLLNVGFNPLNDMAEMTGKSVAQLQDDMSKGNITFEMFEKAVIHATSEGGKYAGMIDAMAQTTSGSFEQMKGSAIASMLDIYNLIQPVLQRIFKIMTSVLGVISRIIKVLPKYAPYIAGITAAVAAYAAVMLYTSSIFKGLTIIEAVQFAWMLALEKAQLLLNAAMSANPIGIVIALVAGLVAAIVVCWNKFAGFRAVILTVWDTIKGFGSIIKEFVINRINDVIRGLGTMGEAIAKFFKGDFSGAYASAKQGMRDLVGVDTVRNAIQSTGELSKNFKNNYADRLTYEKVKQEAKKNEGISTPGVAGAEDSGEGGNGGNGGASDKLSKSAESITTGGTRNTSITMTISKFFDNMNISMASTSSPDELRDTVIECVNRALEIAVSTAR